MVLRIDQKHIQSKNIDLHWMHISYSSVKPNVAFMYQFKTQLNKECLSSLQQQVITTPSLITILIDFQKAIYIKGVALSPYWLLWNISVAGYIKINTSI